MQKIIDKFYNTQFFGRIFHTVRYCVERELANCESVLDLGCGPSSPIQYCKNVKRSVGVEIFQPYLEETKKKKIHTQYLNQKVEEVNFPEKSFDAVILIEVLEHLPKEMGLDMIKKAEKWARKKVIISTPNDFLPQPVYDENVFQRHLSGWSKVEMENFGFECRGLAGLKVLRQGLQDNAQKDGFMNSIRFWPKPFWFVIATLSQWIAYYFPAKAFELFCVKKIHSVK